MIGPSLAGVWDRKAGALKSFSRNSPALTSANIVWNDKTLDEWIADPQHLIPGNQMTFIGVADASESADLLAFLREATQLGSTQLSQQGGSMGGGMMGGMGGMMGGGKVPNLKKLDPSDRVQAITYRNDTYTVTTSNGETHKFWQRKSPIEDGREQRRPGKERTCFGSSRDHGRPRGCHLC